MIRYSLSKWRSIWPGDYESGVWVFLRLHEATVRCVDEWPTSLFAVVKVSSLKLSLIAPLAAHLVVANEIWAISSRHSSSLLSRLSKYHFQIKIIAFGLLETSLSIQFQYGIRFSLESFVFFSLAFRRFLAKHKFFHFAFIYLLLAMILDTPK